MKIKAIPLHERAFGYVAFIITVILTSACIYCAITYSEIANIISVIYALALFVLGTYYASMTQRVNKNYSTRRYQYFELRKLCQEIYPISRGIYDCIKLINFISRFRVITCRMDRYSRLKFFDQYGLDDSDCTDLVKIVFSERFLMVEESLLSHAKEVREGNQSDDDCGHVLMEYQKMLSKGYKSMERNMELIRNQYGDRLISDVNRTDFEKQAYYTTVKRVEGLEESLQQLETTLGERITDVISIIEGISASWSEDLWYDNVVVIARLTRLQESIEQCEQSFTELTHMVEELKPIDDKWMNDSLR